MDSAEGFRAELAGLLGHAPHVLTGQAELAVFRFDTPLGGMLCVVDPGRLHLLEFSDRRALPAELRRLSRSVKGRIGPGRSAVTDLVEARIHAYFAGESADFDLPLALHGSPFQRQVWQALQQLPAGQTISYGELARRIGRPSAVRAVAAANGANQIAVVIPCHRIVAADGALTGYGGGLWRKQALLRHESANFPRLPGKSGDRAGPAGPKMA